MNSTVGIWGLRVPLPVIALGQAVFDIEGLTFQHGLDRFWTEARTPDSEAVADFVAALANTIQLRGVYYRRPGLDAAVQAAARRLDAASGEYFTASTAISPVEQGAATMTPDHSMQPGA